MPAVNTPGEADSGPFSEDGAGVQYAIPLSFFMLHISFIWFYDCYDSMFIFLLVPFLCFY